VLSGYIRDAKLSDQHASVGTSSTRRLAARADVPITASKSYSLKRSASAPLCPGEGLDRELENTCGTTEQLQILERWFSALVAPTQASCGRGAEWRCDHTAERPFERTEQPVSDSLPFKPVVQNN
jgi:hypothetical protein